MIREGARAGTERAKAEGVALGRPSIEDSNASKFNHQGGAGGEKRCSADCRFR
jgi:hypothetical protein